MESDKGAQSDPNVVHLARFLVILSVVTNSVIQKEQCEFSNGQTVPGQIPLPGQPFGDQFVVLLPGIWGAVFAEIVIFTIETDSGLTGRLVEKVRGLLARFGHCGILQREWVNQVFTPHCLAEKW
jgi:hypothetical protein